MEHVRVVARTISLLDSVMFTVNVAGSFEALLTAGGLDVVVARLKDELDYCIKLDLQYAQSSSTTT